jgi:hypothetical protein
MNVRHAALATALAVLGAGVWTAPAFAHFEPGSTQGKGEYDVELEKVVVEKAPFRGAGRLILWTTVQAETHVSEDALFGIYHFKVGEPIFITDNAGRLFERLYEHEDCVPGEPMHITFHAAVASRHQPRPMLPRSVERGLRVGGGFVTEGDDAVGPHGKIGGARAVRHDLEVAMHRLGHMTSYPADAEPSSVNRDNRASFPAVDRLNWRLTTEANGVRIAYSITTAYLTSNIGAECGQPPEGSAAFEPPVAAFDFTPNTPPSAPKAGDVIDFSGAASSVAVGHVTTWSWAFGDGRTGSGIFPTVTYAAPGRYPVTLTVTDDMGRTATVTHDVLVSGPGSKGDSQTIVCPDFTYTEGEILFNIYIPSYAQDPVYVLTPASPICPESTQTITAERLPGNPDGRVDEWGVLKDTFQIRVQLTHAGGAGTGGEMVDTGVTVTWK